MKKLIAALLMIPTMLFAAFPTNTSTYTVQLDVPSQGDFSDFNFVWHGYEDQAVSYYTVTNQTNYITISPYYGMWRMSKRVSGGSNVVYVQVNPANITISNSNLFFAVSRTNVPPNGDYLAQLLLMDTSGTNAIRSLAAGHVRVSQSLWGTNDSLYNYPVNSSWQTNGLTVLSVQTVNFGSGLSGQLTNNILTISSGISGIGDVTAGGTNRFTATNSFDAATYLKDTYLSQTNIWTIFGRYALSASLGTASTNNSGDFYLAGVKVVSATNADFASVVSGVQSGALAGVQTTQATVVAQSTAISNLASAAQITANYASNTVTLKTHHDTGSQSLFLGTNSGENAIGSQLITIGEQCGMYAANASASVFEGYQAGLRGSNASQSVIVGKGAGALAENGSNSVMIGYLAGGNATGTHSSVYIGPLAGRYVYRPYSFILDTLDGTTNSFLYGEFDNRRLVVNGSLVVTNTLTVSGTNIGNTVAAQGVTIGTLQTSNDTSFAWQGSVSNRLVGMVTNGSSDIILGLISGTTVSNAVNGREPVNLDQLRSLLGGNKTIWYQDVKITSAPYTNNVTPTNEVYQLNCTTDLGSQFVRTNASVAIGSYYSANICTSATYTTFQGGSINVDKYVSENDAGTTYIKEEVYRFEPSSSNWIEWGEAAASNLVTGGTATPVLSQFSVPVSSIQTNVPWMIATRTKRVGGTLTPNLIVGGGSNYPSKVTLTLAVSVITAGLIKDDGTVLMKANLNMGGYAMTNVVWPASLMTNGGTYSSLTLTNLDVSGVISQNLSSGSNYFAGRVGIGTNGPQQLLHVNTGLIRVGNDSLYFDFGRDTIDGFFKWYGSQNGASGYKWMSTSGGTLLTNLYLSTAGNLGIGTISPTTKLDVNGAVTIRSNLNMSGCSITNVSTLSDPSILTGVSNTITLGGAVNRYYWDLTNNSQVTFAPCASNYGSHARLDVNKSGFALTLNSTNCITNGLGNVSICTNVAESGHYSYLIDQGVMGTNINSRKIGVYQLR